jgi:4,5-dihydroxyphthalate decarboxylase
MPNLRLSLACWDYDRTRPLIDGRVQPEGIDLDVSVMRPRQIFPRMLDGQEFDASEISLASHATLVGRGTNPFVAIPVVVSKIFRHSGIYVRASSGIMNPADLRGKRVGTTQISSTAVVFMKGLLEEQYGVRQDEMRWVMGGLTSPTQKPLIPLDLPESVELEFLAGRETLEGQFEAGELDALFSIYMPSAFLRGEPWVTRLFEDYRAREEAYFRATGIFPIMHTVAISRTTYERHPWVAQSLYDAFVRATRLAIEDLYDSDALRVTLPWLLHHVEEARQVFGDDYWRHGLKANEATWAAVGRFVHAQGLSPRVVRPKELFVRGVDTQ